MNLISIAEREENVCLIRLEDIILDSECFMPQVMSFLGLSYDDNQKVFLKESQIETRNSTYSNYRRKEDVLYEWKRFVNDENRKSIDQIFSDILARFNYI